MLALVPVVAILPILLYIGMLIGSQAFQETPRRHAPAIVLAFVPNVAAWALAQVKGALSAAGITSVDEALQAKMAGEGVLFQGLEILGGGAVLTGLVLAAVAVFIIERQMWRAAAFAGAGAAMTFFGFMHGERIGLAQSPLVAASYLMVAVFLAGCAKFGGVSPPLAVEPHEHGHA
jgi:adenine/guanine/hypoxanthine permease